MLMLFESPDPTVQSLPDQYSSPALEFPFIKFSVAIML